MRLGRTLLQHPDAGHVNQVAFIIDAPNHHANEWIYVEKGQETVASFDFHRKA
jgi:hypothetical protein